MLRKSAVTAGLVALAAVATGTSAYAYWTVYGEGSATATVAEMKPLNIVGEPITDMVIGGSEVLTGVIKNPNEYEASLIGLKFTTKVSVDRKHHGCGPANFKITTPVQPPSTTVPAKESIPFGGGTIELIETGKDQMACQGAIVRMYYQLR